MANSDYTIRGITMPFCPTALLSSALPTTSTSISIQGIDTAVLDSVRVGSAVMIGDEIVEYVSRSGFTLTVGRGCCDTIPAPHPLGTPVYFFDDSFGSDGVQYGATETISVKPLPRTTSSGVLPVAKSPPSQLTFNSRFYRPYPPGRVRVDGGPFISTPFLDATDTSFELTWVSRNRVTQADVLVDHEEAAITAEAGTTYTVRVFRASDDVEMAVYDLITSDTFVYTQANATADFGNVAGTFVGYLTLESVRDGYSSLQKYRVDFSFEADPILGPQPRGWTDVDATGAFTLTDDDRVATRTGGGSKGVRGPVARASGKWYFEISIITTGNSIAIGLFDAAVAVGSQSYINSTNAWGVWMSLGGSANHNNGSGSQIESALLPTTPASLFMFAVDLDAEKIWIGYDGTWHASGNPAAGTNPTFSSGQLPASSVPGAFMDGSFGAGASVRGRFSTATLQYAPPAGFVPWAGANVDP